MNGLRSASQPPMLTPVFPPSHAAGTRSGRTCASAPSMVSVSRKPVSPRAAKAAGRTGFRMLPLGARTRIGRK